MLKINNKELYKYYCEKYNNNPGRDISYRTFCAIIKDHNSMMREKIIAGEERKIKGIGSFGVIRVERNFKKLRVNWGASNKKKKEIIDRGGTPLSKDNPKGEEWLEYFNDPFWYKIKWDKLKIAHAFSQNRNFYKYEATTSFTRLLRKEILKDEMLLYYYPLLKLPKLEKKKNDI